MVSIFLLMIMAFVIDSKMAIIIVIIMELIATCVLRTLRSETA